MHVCVCVCLSAFVCLCVWYINYVVIIISQKIKKLDKKLRSAGELVREEQ